VLLAFKGFGIQSFTWLFWLARWKFTIYYYLAPWKIGVKLDREVAKKILTFGTPYQLKAF